MGLVDQRYIERIGWKVFIKREYHYHVIKKVQDEGRLECKMNFIESNSDYGFCVFDNKEDAETFKESLKEFKKKNIAI